MLHAYLEPLPPSPPPPFSLSLSLENKIVENNNHLVKFANINIKQLKKITAQ